MSQYLRVVPTATEREGAAAARWRT